MIDREKLINASAKEVVEAMSKNMNMSAEEMGRSVHHIDVLSTTSIVALWACVEFLDERIEQLEKERKNG